MQKFLVILQYACIAFGLYLIYSVSMSLYTQQFELMELVADIGTILICLDLGVFYIPVKVNKASPWKSMPNSWNSHRLNWFM